MGRGTIGEGFLTTPPPALRRDAGDLVRVGVGVGVGVAVTVRVRVRVKV